MAWLSSNTVPISQHKGALIGVSKIPLRPKRLAKSTHTNPILRPPAREPKEAESTIPCVETLQPRRGSRYHTLEPASESSCDHLVSRKVMVPQEASQNSCFACPGKSTEREVDHTSACETAPLYLISHGRDKKPHSGTLWRLQDLTPKPSLRERIKATSTQPKINRVAKGLRTNQKKYETPFLGAQSACTAIPESLAPVPAIQTAV